MYSCEPNSGNMLVSDSSAMLNCGNTTNSSVSTNAHSSR